MQQPSDPNASVNYNSLNTQHFSNIILKEKISNTFKEIKKKDDKNCSGFSLRRKLSLKNAEKETQKTGKSQQNFSMVYGNTPKVNPSSTLLTSKAINFIKKDQARKSFVEEMKTYSTKTKHHDSETLGHQKRRKSQAIYESFIKNILTNSSKNCKVKDKSSIFNTTVSNNQVTGSSFLNMDTESNVLKPKDCNLDFKRKKQSVATVQADTKYNQSSEKIKHKVFTLNILNNQPKFHLNPSCGLGKRKDSGVYSNKENYIEFKKKKKVSKAQFPKENR